MCCMMHGMDHSGQDDHEGHGARNQEGSLLDILRRRFAQGEISQEQYRSMLTVLGLSDERSVESYSHH